MYFVTTKREGYVLFCTTPSERAAVGLTDKQVVHLLARESGASDWLVLAQWNSGDYSHTDFMAACRRRAEPAEPRQLLDLLPSRLR